MAKKDELISIMPKSKEETPSSIKTLFWLFIILLVFLGAIFFFLNSEKKSLAKEKESLSQSLNPTREEKELEETLKVLDKKIDNFLVILEEHNEVSNFFSLLRGKTHKMVMFKELRISRRDMRADLIGETKTFTTLGEQMLILRNSDGINDLNVSNVSLNRDGKVEFSLNFKFENKIIK